MLAELDANSALFLSLKVGLTATLVALIPGAALAFWLARTRSRVRVLVETIVILPMVLPPVVVGYLLLVVFGRQGVLGGLGLSFTWQGAALAALIMGFPLMVRVMRQAFEEVDQGLEDAAALLGAGRLRVFLSVTAPMAMRGLIAGALLCFARSLGEFGATITFAGNVEGEGRTLPVAIWTAMQTAGEDAVAWRMTWICVGVAVSATLLTELLVRRRRRRREFVAEGSLSKGL